MLRCLRCLTFQSTLPCGSDVVLFDIINHLILFQSTLPCGSDTRVITKFSTDANFNPRSLAGATLFVISPVKETVDFNPRSLAGATCKRLEAKEKILFQSTLPCGSDLRCPHDYKCRYISIHAPLRERPDGGKKLLPLFGFQSTLPCGSDQVIIHTSFCYMHFNPRSLAGATFVLWLVSF